MHPAEVLKRHGGVARRRDLLQLTSRRELELAVKAGEVVVDARGRYALADTDDAVRIASAVSGSLSHTSAALSWGWQVKSVPDRPHVTVRHKRRLAPDRREDLVLHWRDLGPDDLEGVVTSRQRTLFDCMKDLPFDEALAIADSALRQKDATHRQLKALAAQVRGAGAKQARRVAQLADRRAANPFESVLRAIALDAGLDVTPQVTIETRRLIATPDLVDVDRRLVLEADSHTWHSTRAALRRDCRRYNALVLDRWTVLRFTWEQVMFEADEVRTCLADAIALTDRQARRARARHKAA